MAGDGIGKEVIQAGQQVFAVMATKGLFDGCDRCKFIDGVLG